MTQILFVCTGNIFRSMTAEFALRALIAREEPTLAPQIRVGSAGIEAKPQAIHPLVVDRLREYGLDVSAHRQRRLDAEMLSATTLCLAMGRDHQRFIQSTFAQTVPLFNDEVYGQDEPVPDVWEAVPDWQSNKQAAAAHTVGVIDYLIAAMPTLLKRIKSSHMHMRE